MRIPQMDDHMIARLRTIINTGCEIATPQDDYLAEKGLVTPHDDIAAVSPSKWR